MIIMPIHIQKRKASAAQPNCLLDYGSTAKLLHFKMQFISTVSNMQSQLFMHLGQAYRYIRIRLIMIFKSKADKSMVSNVRSAITMKRIFTVGTSMPVCSKFNFKTVTQSFLHIDGTLK